MPQPLTARATFLSNPAFQATAQKVAKEQWFKTWLAAALEGLGPFSYGTGFAAEPHVQDRIDGGRQALQLFLRNLNELPRRDPQALDADLPPIKFITPFQAATEDLL